MKKKYLEFKEARIFVRGLQLKNEREYHEWYDKNQPDFLPRHPDFYYSKTINNKKLNSA